MYWVYEDKPTPTARVHLASCYMCNEGKGTHGGITKPDENRWIGPLTNKYEALQEAEATGIEVKLCQI